MWLELETRYSLFSQPGKLRTIGWLNSAYSGSYRETLDNPALNLDIALTRTGRIKYGYVVNLEQAVTDDIGLFGRWSWNDGKTEIMAFTDIDASLSLGVSIKGTKWGRPDDVIGIGGAINALSRDHRDFIAAGGLGILIGDGQLNYRRGERILGNLTLRLRAHQATDADGRLPADPPTPAYADTSRSASSPAASTASFRSVVPAKTTMSPSGQGRHDWYAHPPPGTDPPAP